MGWTYGGDLATSSRDLVRFLIGDTDKQTKYSPADGEVDYWIGLNTDPLTLVVDPYKAASEIATAMGNRFSILAASTVKIGTMELQYDYTALADRYYALAKKLLAGRTAVAQGGPFWDNTQPGVFALGIMDHPGTSDFQQDFNL